MRFGFDDSRLNAALLLLLLEWAQRQWPPPAPRKEVLSSPISVNAAVFCLLPRTKVFLLRWLSCPRSPLIFP
jgi:hypothetical protein